MESRNTKILNALMAVNAFKGRVNRMDEVIQTIDAIDQDTSFGEGEDSLFYEEFMFLSIMLDELNDSLDMATVELGKMFK